MRVRFDGSTLGFALPIGPIVVPFGGSYLEKKGATMGLMGNDALKF